MSVRIFIRAAVAAGAASLAIAPGASAFFAVVSSPNAFSGDNVLNGVSARSSTDAWAVGTLTNARRHSDIGTLTEHWDGLAWSVVPGPDADFFDDEFFAVTDISPTNTWAVGLVKQAGFRSGNPLIAHWNGTSWQTVSPPSSTSGVLRAISADSASDVWTVGDNSNGRAIGFHFDGTAWSVTILPALTGTDVLQGIKAFSPTDVWAVGDLVSSAGQVRTLVMHRVQPVGDRDRHSGTDRSGRSSPRRAPTRLRTSSTRSTAFRPTTCGRSARSRRTRPRPACRQARER